MGVDLDDGKIKDVQVELSRLLEIGKLLASVLTDEEKNSLQLLWSKNVKSNTSARVN